METDRADRGRIEPEKLVLFVRMRHSVTLDMIVKEFGKPTFSSLIVPKENDTVMGTRVIYAYRQNDRRDINSKTDVYTSMSFDVDSRLVGMHIFSYGKMREIEVEK
jgi:hypothetical protein